MLRVQTKSLTQIWKAAPTKGDISRHAEGDGLGQRGGFSEEVQVVEGKDQLDGLIHLNSYLKKK